MVQDSFACDSLRRGHDHVVVPGRIGSARPEFLISLEASVRGMTLRYRLMACLTDFTAATLAMILLMNGAHDAWILRHLLSLARNKL